MEKRKFTDVEKEIARLFGNEPTKVYEEMTDRPHDPGAEVRNRPSPVFPSNHPKVKDDRDHFPIDTIERARNALARVGQYESAPSWWKGSLIELKEAVAGAVKEKHPSIGK